MRHPKLRPQTPSSCSAWIPPRSREGSGSEGRIDQSNASAKGKSGEAHDGSTAEALEGSGNRRGAVDGVHLDGWDSAAGVRAMYLSESDVNAEVAGRPEKEWSPERLHIEASEWIARLDRPDPDGKSHARFRRWLAASARHEAAYARLEALWGRLDGLSGTFGSPRH